MNVTFTCAQCHKEYLKTTADDKVIKRFKKWHPKEDINSAKLVCESCYRIAIRMLEIKTERQNWINYAMSN